MSQSNSNYTLSSSPTDGMWDSDDSASRPRTATTTPTYKCGVVVLPNGSSIFVDDKEAYFAKNPAARASTEASQRDFQAWKDNREMQRDIEVGEKASPRFKEEKEVKLKEEAGLHGCVGGKKVATCEDCKGNGCAYGLATSERYGGDCEECGGKGYTLSPCVICAEKKKKAKDKKPGTWNGGMPRGGPVCAHD